MRILFYLGSLLAFIFAAAPVRAETADEFLKAYFLIQDGDAAEKGGETAKAIEKYSAALKVLREIKRTAPEWNPNIIAYRSKYCAEHIVKAGGVVETEANAPPSPAPAGSAPSHSEPSPSPVNTVPPGAVPSAATAPVDAPAEAAPSATDRITSLARELQEARAELRKVQEEKTDLETRLRRAEEGLKSAEAPGEERVQELLKENNALKQKLAETETKLREMPSSSEDILSLRAQLAQTNAALEAAKKEADDLRAANESLKKDLEDTRTQLRTATSGPAATVAPEVLQTLQKENALLRSIVDRQFQEDARRITARDALAEELKELGSRSESIRAQLEVLQTPLSPLSEEERRLLKTPGAILRVSGDDPTKLSGVVTSPNRAAAAATSSTQLSGDNSVLAADAKRLFAKNDLTGAAAKYEQILQSEPNNLFALSNLGVIRFRQDKVDEAEKTLQAALAIDPQDAFSLSVLGIVYYRQGKFDEAISSLTRAIAINPKNFETHNYLGIAYSQKGYQEAAEKELLKAIELKPDYGDAHFNLAVVFASQTPPSIELARKHYKRAIELGVDKDPELEKLLK